MPKSIDAASIDFANLNINKIKNMDDNNPALHEIIDFETPDMTTTDIDTISDQSKKLLEYINKTESKQQHTFERMEKLFKEAEASNTEVDESISFLKERYLEYIISANIANHCRKNLLTEAKRIESKKNQIKKSNQKKNQKNKIFKIKSKPDQLDIPFLE